MKRSLNLLRLLRAAGSAGDQIASQSSASIVQSLPASSTVIPALASSTQGRQRISHHGWSYSTASSSDNTPSPPTEEHIEITSIADFQSVVQLSTQVPVVIDAYTQWCGPCKQLDSVLKSAIAALNGQVRLAKIDIDRKDPDLTKLIADMGITSVPTLFLLLQGRILDVKQGATSPSDLSKWLNEAAQLAKATAPEAIVSAHQSVKEGLQAAFDTLDDETLDINTKITSAAPLFAAALNDQAGSDAEDKVRATAGLALCAVLEGHYQAAKEIFANAQIENKETGKIPDEYTRAQAMIELATEAEQLEKQDGGSGGDELDALYKAAITSFLAGQHQQGIDIALNIIKKDKSWKDQAGKALVLKFCDGLGIQNKLSFAARRRLSNVLFM